MLQNCLQEFIELYYTTTRQREERHTEINNYIVFSINYILIHLLSVSQVYSDTQVWSFIDEFSFKVVSWQNSLKMSRASFAFSSHFRLQGRRRRLFSPNAEGLDAIRCLWSPSPELNGTRLLPHLLLPTLPSFALWCK